MKFSIIIPVYNVEDYVAECLDSILQQTYQDYEIILIDDGSTDNSGKICETYAQRYPDHIRLIHQENQGLVKTRVTGLHRAGGEICIFVDSDDALRRDALEKINEAFENTGCDLVLYGLSRDPDFSRAAYTIPLGKGQCFEGKSKKNLYALMVTCGKMNSMCIKATRKEVYDHFLRNYVANPDMTYGEDLYLSLPLITHAEKITWLGENLYFYRNRAGSMVNSFCPSLHRSVKIVQMEMEKYISLWEIQDYYPVFYTKVVYNWIHALKNLLKNQRILKRKEVTAILHELSGDAFFRKAYENMEPECLTRRDRRLATWLYKKRFHWLRWLGRGFTLLKKLKEKICRTFAK